jgi:putative acetyltransferase
MSGKPISASAIQIRVATASDIDDVRTLMRHYNAFLGSLGVDLCFQDFDRELESLPGKYAPPLGQLWIARDETTAPTVATVLTAPSVPLGIIAVKPLDEPDTCEMKRLWVEPAAQGTGLGRALAETSIAFARNAGYRYMKLDTLGNRMGAAVALYRKLGFVETEAYVHNPEQDVLYMKLEL